jgi:hypothetical protein
MSPSVRSKTTTAGLFIKGMAAASAFPPPNVDTIYPSKASVAATAHRMCTSSSTMTTVFGTASLPTMIHHPLP